MEEAEKRGWDVRLSIIAPILTLVTIVVGVWQFNRGEENRRVEQAKSEAKQAEVEFQRRLWLQRQEVYRQVAQATGDVVAAQGWDRKDADAAFRKFLSVYWGAAILVQDAEVEKAMKLFYLDLLDVRSGWAPDDRRLKARADQLVTACRTNLEKSAPRGAARQER